MPALTDPLDDAQLALLKVMAEPFLKDGQWPFWHYVEGMMDQLGFDDAEGVLKSLPKVGGSQSSGLVGPWYGLAWYDRVHLADDSRPALTAAAGLHSPELRHFFGDNFVSVLQYLVKHQRNVRLSPNQSDPTYITSEDFKRDHPAVTDEFVAALPGVFEHEPVLRRGYQPWGMNPGGWRFQLHKWLKDYRNIDDLPGYVARVVEVTEAAINSQLPASPLPAPSPIFGSSGGVLATHGGIAAGVLSAGLPTVTGAIIPRTVLPPEEPPQYVDEDLIKELETKQGHTRLSPDKLLQLMRELNACFRGGHAYACHALVRAIIDHVPPILGQKSFQAAASNYAWPTEADRKYAKKLLEFKNQADDVMHRQIRTSRGVITMHDVPLRAYINALLRVCIDQL
ncbi:hypothetical protein ACFWIJ_02175 [Streptomyces sp. NPDC127079]|uniref:hypothetical protein n=1 Tax=Streptomyces sp. NPDC127079 TaxID=3347132 RepID=UPI00364F7BD3